MKQESGLWLWLWIRVSVYWLGSVGNENMGFHVDFRARCSVSGLQFGTG